VKVYLATAGQPGDYDYKVVGIFARREDADAFRLAERVEEWDVDEAPVPLRIRHTIAWDAELKHAPTWTSDTVPARGSVPEVEETGTSFACWDREQAREVFDRQQAARARRAADLVAGLDRVDVQVWYEPGNGTAVLLTPLHTTKELFKVDRDRITDQAGLPRGAYLHGKWFTVETCTVTEVDGFSVCEKPDISVLAKG
jgi:hypothetical protein